MKKNHFAKASYHFVGENWEKNANTKYYFANVNWEKPILWCLIAKGRKIWIAKAVVINLSELFGWLSEALIWV